MLIEPAFIPFLVTIIEQVGLQQLIHQARHALEDLLADRRSPDPQRKPLSGLFVGDILSRPRAQLLTLLRGRVLLR